MLTVCMIATALKHAGYPKFAPTEKNLIKCYKEYVDARIFRDVKLEEVDNLIAQGKITTNDIISNLMSL